MKLKAMLVCEDIRFEAAGTVTLAGVFDERLIAPLGDGPIQLARFAFLAVIGGLRSVEPRNAWRGTTALPHAGNTAGFSFTVPVNPALPGLVVGVQGLVVDAAAPSGIGSVTNALVLRLN